MSVYREKQYGLRKLSRPLQCYGSLSGDMKWHSGTIMPTILMLIGVN